MDLVLTEFQKRDFDIMKARMKVSLFILVAIILTDVAVHNAPYHSSRLYDQWLWWRINNESSSVRKVTFLSATKGRDLEFWQPKFEQLLTGQLTDLERKLIESLALREPQNEVVNPRANQQ
jgi:hypothetical protein